MTPGWEARIATNLAIIFVACVVLYIVRQRDP